MTEKGLSRIVVGTDFNELATAGLRFAAEIARRAGASLTIVYADIFDAPAEFTSSQIERLAESIERTKKRTREQLEQYATRHVPPGITSKVVVAEGAPAGAIAKLAAAERADFIALGTHGRGGLQRLVLGSVAEAVIREAVVPVLTVRSTSTPESIRRILVPVNESEIAAIAVERAAQIARAVGAELTLLHAARRGERRRFDVGALLPPDLRTSISKCEIDHDDPSVEILAADECGTYDLIVVGAEHRRVRDVTVFGSTAASVTRHARSPVLTVTRKVSRSGARPAAAAEAGRA